VQPAELLDLLSISAARGAPVWIRAHGASMRPAIPPGTSVRLAPAPARQLQSGEVVLAIMPWGTPVLHRVVAERDGVVRLRGDARVRTDPLIPRTQVVAVADRIRRGAVDCAVPPAERVPWRRWAGTAGCYARAALARWR
jgi:hypothetical protein